MSSLDPDRVDRVVDFGDPAEVARWSGAGDVVMGGVSTSRLSSGGDGTALFTGEVSLEQGGGFASVRSKSFPRELRGATALVVRLRGDGKRYRLRLRTTSDHGGVSYLASLPAEPDTWCEPRLRPSDFVATWRGRAVRDAPALEFGDILSFGLLIGDRQAGPFRLELAWIATSPRALPTGSPE